MKEEDIKKSFDNLKPSDEAKQRILNNILYKSNDENWLRSVNMKKVIPVLGLMLIFLGGFIFYNLNREIYSTDKEILIAEDSNIEIAKVTNQFKIGNKTYNILSESEKAEFKFQNTIETKDIGDKITTITTTVDESLKVKEVYKYIPAECDAVVAVKLDNEYKLFKFFWFDSYVNNQDEDVKTYLELYGIAKGEDISKIQFMGHSEEAKMQGKVNIINEIADRENILEFYNYYSVIKNSSDEYFNKLFNYRKSDIQNPNTDSEPKTLPPDYKDNTNKNSNGVVSSNIEVHSIANTDEAEDLPASIQIDSITDTGEVKENEASISSGNSTPSSEGNVGNALGNSVTIRIYNKSGVYFNSEYYLNIGFISRHEVNEDFERFLSRYIK